MRARVLTGEALAEAQAYNERHHARLLERLRKHQSWSRIARQLLYYHDTGGRFYGPDVALAANLPD